MKVALVTGGSRGIGATIVDRLSSDGMAVACTATSLDRAESVAKDVQSRYGRPVLPIEMHVEDPESVRRAFATVGRELGPVSLLVNNAGINQVASIVDADLDVISQIIDVNLKGLINCSQVAANAMIEADIQGSIINIGSLAGLVGFPSRAAYGSSKAGVHHFTKVLAVELANHKIRVNCVAPGFVQTGMLHELVTKGLINVDAVRQRTPLADLVPVDEIAEAVVWLASAAARSITGQILAIDGGWTAYVGHPRQLFGVDDAPDPGDNEID